MRQASYKSIAKTTSPPATVAKPRTPTYLVGSIRDSVRPEALEWPVLRALEGPVLRAHEGGPPPPAAPHHSCLNPVPSPQEPHPLCAGRHTDTALLPPLRCLRYRLPMAVAISHRNRNITAPHADGGARLVVGGMVRIDGQGCLGKYQGGLSTFCEKILGFIANLSQASYKSNAKTTSPPVTVAKFEPASTPPSVGVCRLPPPGTVPSEQAYKHVTRLLAPPRPRGTRGVGPAPEQRERWGSHEEVIRQENTIRRTCRLRFRTPARPPWPAAVTTVVASTLKRATRPPQRLPQARHSSPRPHQQQAAPTDSHLQPGG